MFQVGTRLYKDTWRSPQAEGKDDHKDKTQASKSEEEPLKEMGLMQEFSKSSEVLGMLATIHHARSFRKNFKLFAA